MKKNFNFQTFIYAKHMLEKADERNIDLNPAEQTVEFGKKIAEYPEDKPYKRFLHLSFFDGKPLHVCFAPVNEGECKVITAHEPSLLIFENDFKTKRK